jgi:hypothetical protein
LNAPITSLPLSARSSRGLATSLERWRQRLYLRPGGVALVTVPGISSIADKESDWYWLLTDKSATRLFADEFGAENI